MLRVCVWFGNIRQMQNALKHACIGAKGSIRAGDLPSDLKDAFVPGAEPVRDSGPIFSEPTGLLTLWQAEARVVEDVERRMISEALVLSRGDSAAAANSLDLHPKTLARKMNSYGLTALVGFNS